MKKMIPSKIRHPGCAHSSPLPADCAQHRPGLCPKHDLQFHHLQTGISNSLAVIMMFGFVLGIFAVIYGGFAIRRGDVDQGKMSIIGGAIIAAAPAAVFAFYKIFGLDANSAVGVGNF